LCFRGFCDQEDGHYLTGMICVLLFSQNDVHLCHLLQVLCLGVNVSYRLSTIRTQSMRYWRVLQSYLAVQAEAPQACRKKCMSSISEILKRLLAIMRER